MTTARRAILCMAALVLLGVPRSASASGGDVIFGMSGPQWYGFVSGCDYLLGAATRPVCRVIGKRVTGRDADDPLVITADGAGDSRSKIWLTLDGTFYISTGNNSESIDYKAFDYYMVAFEPLLQVQSVQCGKVALFHGVIGITYDMLFGKGFDSFDNIGLKIRPIGITVGQHFEFAYNLRIYPRGFIASDFGLVDPAGKPRPDAETVHGISIGWRW